MWKKLRISILLLILVIIVINTVQEKADLNWKNSFFVAIYPINADGSAQTERYIQSLTQQEFEPVADSLNQQAKQYALPLYRPINVMLGHAVTQIPPAPPSSNPWLKVIVWSLKMRYYGWKHQQDFKLKPNIQLFVLYYDPKNFHVLSHSTALAKGRIGRVNLFASTKQHEQNMVVLTHELLHTLGATDKYDLATNLPIYPDGFANQQPPLYPQTNAELMAGRIPLSPSKAVIPNSLAQTVVGVKTAKEIGWIK